MLIRGILSSNSSSSASAIKYMSEVNQALSVNIASDFPNYRDLTSDNIIVETLPRGNSRLFANSGDSIKGNVTTAFYKANVTYDPNTGNLTISRPYGTYNSGASYTGTIYFKYNVYIAENIVSS